ncbi:LITAF domain-containing protein [Caenorhabditis elegans]|uniref:LITAF domain-containing protein n=1 Tax=Caenorhabditis elegans TaxID=6239 RepID=O61958_CAEEL|nr:LITAF domain-containing protein [Caenorhabditis elegans]CCD61781.1 LITAF domain-containing protein [Caenorhabditis elegans]|eukprot:NP_503127.2 Uncharacterized protein CELE_B0348.2 [Caenorhabditis elegans]
MTTTVVVLGPTLTECTEPHQVFCQKCQCNQVTRTETQLGACWWVVFIIGCLLFWPICYWLCCDSSKDTMHYCPSCGTLLEIRKGGC